MSEKKIYNIIYYNLKNIQDQKTNGARVARACVVLVFFENIASNIAYNQVP